MLLCVGVIKDLHFCNLDLMIKFNATCSMRYICFINVKLKLTCKGGKCEETKKKGWIVCHVVIIRKLSGSVVTAVFISNKAKSADET